MYAQFARLDASGLATAISDFWRWHGLTGQNGFVTLELIDTE